MRVNICNIFSRFLDDSMRSKDPARCAFARTKAALRVLQFDTGCFTASFFEELCAVFFFL